MPQGTRNGKSLLNLERLLEHLSYEDKLRELKRRLQGGLVTQDLKRAYKKNEEQLLAWAFSDKREGLWSESRFKFYIGKKFFPARVMRHWNRSHCLPWSIKRIFNSNCLVSTCLFIFITESMRRNLPLLMLHFSSLNLQFGLQKHLPFKVALKIGILVYDFSLVFNLYEYLNIHVHFALYVCDLSASSQYNILWCLLYLWVIKIIWRYHIWNL